MVLEQLAEIGIEADMLMEPMRRDTGIASGATFAQVRGDRACARRRPHGAGSRCADSARVAHPLRELNRPIRFIRLLNIRHLR
jgi:hypothetical protein